MKRLTSLLLSAICSFTLLNARTIQGVVKASNDSTTIVGANCTLSVNGKFIAGTITNADGVFSLEADSKSSLSLDISMTGYSPTAIIIESGTKNLNLGTIFLDAGVSLKEVTVTGNSVINSNGRTIVYPSAADIKSSSTSISLFQKLPLAGLEANPINRTISVDNATPVILINGVPSTIDDLNALQPKEIERVEYSRFTPARYADSSKSGLINITLKKRDDGGQIYAWARSAVNTTFFDANIRASYHQGPSQLSLQYIPSWRNYKEVYDNTSESYIGDDFRVNLEAHDRNPFNYHYHQIKLKYDFTPSAKTLFSATFTALPISNKSQTFARTIDSELGTYDNNNLTTSKDFTPSLDLFLRQDFNEKNSLEAQVVGTFSSSDYRRDNNYIFADGNNNSYLYNVDSRRKSLISEINYIHTFSAKTSLSAGYQNTISHSTNTYLTSDYKPILTENNNYTYVSLSQSVGKFYFRLATGAKLFWIKNDINKRHFIKNLTSAQASWTINSIWNIRATFRYTPTIPSLTALTDYPQQSTPYLISNGNPNLKVSDNFAYTLGVNYNYKKVKLSFQSSYYSRRNDIITNVSYLGNKMFLSQATNARYRHEIYNNVDFTISDIKGFGASVNLGVYNYKSAAEDWSRKLTTFEGVFSLWWNNGPFTITYWRKIPSKYLNGYCVSKDENGDQLEVEYNPNKHWSIGASWMYMFDKKGTQYPSWSYSPVNPYFIERYIKNNGNMVVISVSYSADFGSIFRTGRRSLNNSDNSSSIIKY